jgi:hypothetical protein
MFILHRDTLTSVLRIQPLLIHCQEYLLSRKTKREAGPFPCIIFVAVTIIKLYNNHALFGGAQMAGAKNENKRSLILRSSKMLFVNP